MLRRSARLSAKRHLSYKEKHPFHAAVKSGCLEDVRHFLENDDVVVDAEDSDGLTPFALACREENVNIGIVGALLKAGADPSQSYFYRSGLRYQTTAVDAACQSGNAELLQLLLQYTISVNEEVLIVNAARQKREGTNDVIRLLLGRITDVDKKKSVLDATLLAACSWWNTAAARMLLEAGASANSIRNFNDETALHAACMSTSPGIVELLLQHKADVNRKDGYGHTPLLTTLRAHCCNVEEKLAVVKLLVSHGAEIHSKQDGYTPLFWAVESGCAKTTRLLLQLGAKPNVPEKEESPLHAASMYWMHDIAEMLLDAGAAVNAVGEDNCIPLNEALASHYEVSRPGRCYSTKTEENVLRTVDLLVSRGADVDWRDRRGCAPLHRALDRFWAPESILRITRLLLQHDADPSVRDADGKTPLLVLCEKHVSEDDDFDYADVAEVLLDHGAEVEDTDECGLTPFLHSVNNKRSETLEELLDHRVDTLPLFEE